MKVLQGSIPIAKVVARYDFLGYACCFILNEGDFMALLKVLGHGALLGFLLSVSYVGAPRSLHAQESLEREEISLAVSPGFFQNLCTYPEWKGQKVFWKGVEDQRPQGPLGRVSKKKGKDLVQVYANPDLERVLAENLQRLFQDCGLTLLSAPSGEVPSLRVTVQNFYAEEEKGLVTGKGKARSRLSFEVQRPGRKLTASVGYELEYKQTRKRGIERLQKVLQELLEKTLVEVTRNDSLQKLGS